MAMTQVAAKRNVFQRLSKLFRPDTSLPKVKEEKLLRSSSASKSEVLFPEEVEGQAEIDELPQYACDLEMEGFVFVRQEREPGGEACKDKTWKRVYLSVRGTRAVVDYGASSRRRLSLINTVKYLSSESEPSIGFLVNPTRDLPPYERHWQLDGAQLVAAPEYSVTRPFTFRLQFTGGEQVLVRSDSAQLALAWAELIRSAINVAPDLDMRPEPAFRLIRRTFIG